MKPRVVPAVKYILLQDMTFLCIKIRVIMQGIRDAMILISWVRKPNSIDYEFTLSNMSRNSKYFPTSKFLVQLDMTEAEEIKHSESG